MLTTYLNNQPYSKFVLIEDSLEQRGEEILKYLINSHLKHANLKIHYFVFEGNFKTVSSLLAHPNVEYHDFVSDSRGWLNASNKLDFATIISQINRNNSVFVIDSLSHAILQCGEIIVYKVLLQLLSNKDLLRIVTILHQDVLEHPSRVCRIFQHLATLSLTLEPNFNSASGRIAYTYKKSSGKIIRQIEEYKFENGLLKSEVIKKIDPKTLVQENLNQVLPENLTTFKISLDDTEKESRSKLVLPYLPKESGADGDDADGGKIFYQFDHVDDWDEEDPDDDLDI